MTIDQGWLDKMEQKAEIFFTRERTFRIKPRTILEWIGVTRRLLEESRMGSLESLQAQLEEQQLKYESTIEFLQNDIESLTQRLTEAYRESDEDDPL